MIFFLLEMNPRSKRHWRHFTPSAAVVLFLMSAYWVFLAVNKVRPADLVLVYEPASFGLACLLLVPCMRKSVEEEPEALVKLDDDEKEAA
jgi:hypothetical protein